MTDEAARELADLGADLQRRDRARARVGLPGGAPCPPFLAASEAEAPGAARLHHVMDGRAFTRAEAEEAGAWVEMDASAVGAALAALRRAELLTADGDGRMRVHPPSGLPF